MHRPPFESFVAPARRRPQVWRLLLGVALVVAVYMAIVAGGFAAIAALRGPEAAAGLVADILQPERPGPTLYLLATFGGMAAAAAGAAVLLHRRSPATLFGRAPRVLRDFVVAGLVVGTFYGATLLVWALVYDATPNLEAGRWAALLPLTLAGLLLQTGAEEMVFRGYLTQQAAARFRSPLVWLVLPSLLFGLVHWDPTTAGPNAWIVVAGATLFGLAAADLTAATGSIGAAWGFHFVNNFVALAVLATEGTITGLALYTTPYAADAEGGVRWVLLADFLLLGAAWALCRGALRR